MSRAPLPGRSHPSGSPSSLRTWRRGIVGGLAAAVLLVPAISAATPVVAASSTLYVDRSAPNCSDTGTGTQTQPYCTIGAAATAATAGVSVVVNSGTYPENVNVGHSGLKGAPITFAPAAGASVTISGQLHGFTVSGLSYILISGFTITSTTSTGISVFSSNNITISNNTVTGAGQRSPGSTAAGIALSGTTSSLVTHNRSDNNSDHGIYLSGASANNTVSFNEASLNAEGWQRNANGINVIGTGSTGNILFGNVVHDNEDTGLQFYPGANNGAAVDNVSYNNGDHGIDDLNVTGGVLTGNTVYHNCTSGINVEGTSGNYTIENNIAVDNAVYPAYNGISCSRRTGNIGIYDSAPTGTIADYNLVNLTTSGDLDVWAGTTYSTIAALNAASGQEQHGIQADPKWVSSSGGNFHLQPGSPAIDSANSGAPSEPAADIEGNPRVDDPATPNTGAGSRAYDDRGAYEFQPAISDTQPPSVPTGLAAVASSPNKVALTWNASTDNVGVIGYTVYRNGAWLMTVTSPGYTDSSVSQATTYTYAVDAFDAAGNHSAASSPVSVTTPLPDTQPPSVPTGLTAPAAGATLMNLAWNASTDNVGVTGYTIYRNGTAVATSATTTFTDSGLSPNTTYSYSVDAFDAAGNHSAQSTTVAATTGARPVAYVQGGSISKGKVTSVTLTIAGPVGAGDLLAGLFAEQNAAGQVAVSDNVNGAWTRGRGITYTNGKGDIALYYLANSRASATGLTITISASAPTNLNGSAAEYSGVASSSALDQVALRSGSGPSVDSGATGSVGPGELVFGAVTANGSTGTITGGSSQGFTFTVRSTFGNGGEGDILAGKAGAQDARFGITKSVTWYALAAVFRPAMTTATVDTQAPSTPTGLTAQVGAPGEVDLAWAASTDNVGVTGYTVYRNGTTLATVGGSTLSYADKTVAGVSSYTYTVDAFDAAGNHSTQSAPASVTTPDWTPPSAPSGQKATVISSSEIDLSWQASTDNVGVAGYTVYRNGTAVGTTGSGTLVYADTGLGHGFTYSYTVTANDAAGNVSAQSAPVSASTPDDIPPTTPGGLGATASSPTNVLVSWTASSDNVGVAGYDIYRDGAIAATVGGSTLTFTDSVASGSTHSYTVDAFDAAGNHSGTPPAVTATTSTSDTTPPSTPTGLAASASGPTQVSLTWNASTDNVGVSGYTIYRNGATLATVSGATLAYSDSAVTPATNYSYAVDAFDAAGNHSALSSTVSVHVPGQPKFVQGKAVTTGSRVTSLTITFGPVAQGDLLVGWFGQYDSSGQVTVSDNVNGAWTRSASTTWHGGTAPGDIALYYFANSAAATNGLTITISAPNATYLQAGPAEYSGVATVNPLDQVVIAKGSSTSADSGLTPATGSGELVYGGMVATSGPGLLTPGTSQGVTYVKRAQSTSGSQGEEDIVASAAGQQHAGFTFATSTAWFTVCAVFKAA